MFSTIPIKTQPFLKEKLTTKFENLYGEVKDLEEPYNLQKEESSQVIYTI